MQALGKDSYWFKMGSLVIGRGDGPAPPAASSPTNLRFIDPSTFVMWLTFFIFLPIMMGAWATTWGVNRGDRRTDVLREGLRFVGLPAKSPRPLQHSFSACY